MKKRQSVILTPDRQIRIEDEPRPSAGANGIVCRTLRSVISAGTELGKITGGFYWTNLPCLLGYSNVAVIEEAGPEVDGFQLGQRIFSQCSHSSYFLIESPADSRFVPCILPEEVDDEAGTFITHCAVAWYGVRKARLQPEEAVLILGDGLVGLLALQLARHSGCHSVFLAGHHDFRLAKANAFGAKTVNSARDNLAEFAREMTGGNGFPIVLNTAGAVASVGDAIAACGVHGRIIQLGTISEPVTLPTWEIERKEIAFIPAFQPLDPRVTQYTARRLMIELLRDGKLQVADLITHRLNFRRAGEAYELLMHQKDTALGVLFTYEDA